MKYQKWETNFKFTLFSWGKQFFDAFVFTIFYTRFPLFFQKHNLVKNPAPQWALVVKQISKLNSGYLGWWGRNTISHEVSKMRNKF